MKKILLVANNGGHLLQLFHLLDIWKRYPRAWVTGNKGDARSLLQGENVYFAHFPTDRNLPNLLRNVLLARKVLAREKPNWIISTGAAQAIPYCLLAKFFSAKVMFIESFAKRNSPTLTGRIAYKFSDLFIVQWEELKQFYPQAVFAGTIYDDLLDRGIA